MRVRQAGEWERLMIMWAALLTLFAVCAVSALAQSQPQMQDVAATRGTISAATLNDEFHLAPEVVTEKAGVFVVAKATGASAFKTSAEKPHKAYLHLENFIQLLRGAKYPVPFVQVIVVNEKELVRLVSENGCADCPYFHEAMQKKFWGRVFTGSVRVYMTDLNTEERIFDLESYLALTAVVFERLAQEKPAPGREVYELWKYSQPAGEVLYFRMRGHVELARLNWPPPPPAWKRSGTNALRP